MRLNRAAPQPTSWRGLIRNIIVLVLIGLPSASMAQDEVKLSPEQARNVGVRTVHPVSSPTDETLPFCSAVRSITDVKRQGPVGRPFVFAQ
jgi:hypothetical protein